MQRILWLQGKQRKLYSGMRNCHVCLGPWMKCKKKCINESKVRTAKLLCPECTDWGVHNNMPPTNILVCIYPQHTKLNMDVLLEELRSISQILTRKDCSSHYNPIQCKPHTIRTYEELEWKNNLTNQNQENGSHPTHSCH